MDPYEHFAQQANRDRVDRIERRREAMDRPPISGRRHSPRRTVANVNARALHARLSELARRYGAIDGWHLKPIPIDQFCEDVGVALPRSVNSFCSRLRQRLKAYDTPRETLWLRYWYDEQTPWDLSYPVIPGKTSIAVLLKPTGSVAQCDPPGEDAAPMASPQRASPGGE